MHFKGILWVIFRVLLVGFGLFGPGAARAPLQYLYSEFLIYIRLTRATVMV